MAFARKGVNGKWLGIYRDHEGRQRSKTFDLKRDAMTWAAAAEAKARDRADAPSGDQRFSSYAFEWKEGQLHRRPSTRAATDSLMKVHILPELGSTALSDISTRDLQRWTNELAKKVSPETVGKIVRTVRQILAAAVGDGAIRSNPAEAVNLPPVEQRDVDFLTKDELMEMVRLTGELAYDEGREVGTYKALIAVLGTCGLRIGEAAALQLDRDIVEGPGETKIIRVRRTLSTVEGVLEEGPVKTANSRRDVPVPATVWSLVEAHLEATCAFRREHDLGRPRLFVTPRCQQVRAKNVRRDVLARVRTELGKPNLRIHDLRHTAISLWIEQGWDPKAVAEVAGHGSVSTVLDRYGHLWPNRAVELMQGMDLPFE